VSHVSLLLRSLTTLNCELTIHTNISSNSNNIWTTKYADIHDVLKGSNPNRNP